MNIQIPDEFRKACRNLAQGLEVATAEEFIQHALIGIDLDDAHAIRIFIDGLLKSNPSADELIGFWRSTPADIVFYDGEGVRTFLSMLRDVLDRSPYVDEKPKGGGTG